MKPALFEYRRAHSVDEALDVLAEEGDEVSVLAGGQSLIPLLNLRLAQPGVLLDINRVAGLDGITLDGQRVAVGALARARGVERSAEIAATLPVVPAAIAHIAHPQIRARTTIGGNIAHADPSSELPAVLLALGGAVTLARRGSSRTVPAPEFFQDVFTTAKEPDELVVEVSFPVRDGFRWHFAEVARRHGDYGMVSACVGLHVEDGVVADARIALAGCGPVPVRATAAEEALRGAPAGGDVAAAVAAEVRASVDPSSDIHATAEYRRWLAGVLVARSVASILEEAW